MVRYSRLEFRALARKYKAELTFSPMTVANSFCRSELARQHEFTTNVEDSPMIVQFAANSSVDFQHATEMVLPYADGVDLNAGCPQRWAMQDGYGSYLLKKPEVIEDMLKAAKRIAPSDFSVSVKVRLLGDLNSTIEFCQQLERMNPTFVTIHGRTPSQKSTSEFPVNVEALREIKKHLHIPVIFNGDVDSIEEADKFYEATKCDGMMSARAMLVNPALFAGFKETPVTCVQDWVNIHHQQSRHVTYQTFHHHLVFMMENLVTKSERNHFNELTKKEQCLEFLKEKFAIEPQPIEFPSNLQCVYDGSKYKDLINQEEFWSSDYSTESNHGKFFLSKMHKVKPDPDTDYLDFMDSFLFD